ncbi:TonB-dependent receptor [Thalassomonas haliotis]|uniref:TonB-dependent receptor n=1 Tax=Thalassomonas haliotis TaxID=485448 RepID=A0ABY7V7P0_9GAMM|nr:TonB-dependent receptor [Thalassomonas haliotis]WDE09679.1 TonB-dependent receptor [Thalassomonas haliotis]
MFKSPLVIAISAALYQPLAFSFANDLEHITVTSDFRQQSLAEVPVSVAVIDQQQIIDEGGQHFEEVINKVANLNFAGGTSRPKYFQIRGVGERSEYRGAPNSSVGFILDDIDMSGLGMAANMYDVGQVEVLRGPQGTRYGANALAGLIYIQSNAPTETFEHGVQTTLGDDDLQTYSGYSSGPVTDKLFYRAVFEQHKQNGYRDNKYLGRDDSNGIDEFTGKLKLRYLASDELTLDFTYLHADLDNGFDAWTLDNNGFDTLSDQPGVDNQQSDGLAVKARYTGFEQFALTSITSMSDTDHQHAYDGDWANPEYWQSKPCVDYYDKNGNGESDDIIGCTYDYLWDKRAERTSYSQEIRLSSNRSGRLFNGSTDWLGGIYFSKLDEENDLDSSYNGWPDEVLDSEYQAKNAAIFGQLDSELSQGYQLSVGLRLEHRSTDYDDSKGDEFSPSENMWGGHLALSKQLNNKHGAYARLSKGYKAGGFNMDLPAELSRYKEFDTETLINYELGLKSQFAGPGLSTNLAVFYMDRQDQQVNASQQNPDEPQRFIIYTANAASSTSYGVEFDLNWTINQQLSFDASIGYLNARYDDYAYQDKYGSEVDISERELAHAPEYTYSAGLTYRADNGWFSHVSLSGKSDFYYSDSHDEKADGSNLVNARIGYEADQWAVYLWARNLSDEKYGTRGFYFGNEPDLDWASKKYVRYGAPRQLGITASYEF